jgi:SAM-dependent methyltransferase
VHEITSTLPDDAYLLDLGSGAGSFDPAHCRAKVIRVDSEMPARALQGGLFVQADAARLPFRSGFFDAVVSNHSLEHIADLDAALRETGMVLKRPGALYVAVPDCTRLCDRLYRCLARGGGHLNRFSAPEPLISRIEAATGLDHFATRFLLTSLSFLNPRNRKAPAPRKLWLLAGGNELVLVLLSGLLRLMDGIVRTRLAVYGWASYFGDVKIPVSTEAWSNVCARCGSGHPSSWLVENGRLRWRRLLYRCPQCQALNIFTSDRAYRYLALRAPPQPGE